MANTNNSELFIVDNSTSGWTAFKYLDEWCQISNKFDIATGFFEIGSLLDLDGSWQKLEKIRILMGDQASRRTQQTLINALSNLKNNTDENIESVKNENPFLNGLDSILEGIKSGKIEIRIYNESKFHAKTYITHAKLDVIGSKALVGSSNFTSPGLTQNIELNIQVQSSSEVEELQNWFEEHWEKGKPVSEDIVKIITRHSRDFSPLEVFTKALHEIIPSYLPSDEWEANDSIIYKELDQYQKDAYFMLREIANKFNGAFLCDGVGLGKSYVGLMLLEKFILHENKRVLLVAPRGAIDTVWEPLIKKFLPEFSQDVDFRDLVYLSNNDLDRRKENPARFKRLAELTDVVIVDESHNFRNKGKKADPMKKVEPSRYYKLLDILDQEKRKKQIFMLTATPINNDILDLKRMIELFSKQDESYFSKTLGISSLSGYFRGISQKIGEKYSEIEISENLSNVNKELKNLDDKNILESLIVQRSRKYIIESQKNDFDSDVVFFPERDKPNVAHYHITKMNQKLLGIFQNAFKKEKPLLNFSIYNPYAFYIGDKSELSDEELNLAEGRSLGTLSLRKITFLKRFESSIQAFESTCNNILEKMTKFIKINLDNNDEKVRFGKWLNDHDDNFSYLETVQLQLFPDQKSESLENVSFDDYLDNIKEEHEDEILSRDKFDVSKMIDETYQDMEQILKFIDESKKITPDKDDKLKKLIRLLKSKDFKNQKVLIFTEFSATARYLYRELKNNGIQSLEQIDSQRGINKLSTIQEFSPYYNDYSKTKLKDENRKEINCLISTDLLSEGLNLQDCTKLINYDIHWNPVRIMQRIGRIDRRLDKKIEDRIIKDNHLSKTDRGRIQFWNFLPPEHLEQILDLYKIVSGKALKISSTLGIEGGQIFSPDDKFDPLREFNVAYEGEKSNLENIYLEYQQLINKHPELKTAVVSYPNSIFSGKKYSENAKGVFFCYRIPSYDISLGKYSHESGNSRWFFYQMDNQQIYENINKIVEIIRSKKNTPRNCEFPQEKLIEIKKKVETHIKNNYLKNIDAPIGVNAKLKCWLEIN